MSRIRELQLEVIELKKKIAMFKEATRAIVHADGVVLSGEINVLRADLGAVWNKVKSVEKQIMNNYSILFDGVTGLNHKLDVLMDHLKLRFVLKSPQPAKLVVREDMTDERLSKAKS